MTHRNLIRSGGGFTCISVLALLVGCAGTPPAPKFSHTMVSEARIGPADTEEVSVEPASGVTTMLQVDKDRISQKVKGRIDARKATNQTAVARTLQVVVHVTRYEKGSAFARAMLAGLGQIHLEGTVTVYQLPEKTVVAEFDLSKTFAWGGIYGASTSMDNIEDTFADAVAATVTGQQVAEKDKKQKS